VFQIEINGAQYEGKVHIKQAHKQEEKVPQTTDRVATNGRKVKSPLAEQINATAGFPFGSKRGINCK
jgi:hypothetical protein